MKTYDKTTLDMIGNIVRESPNLKESLRKQFPGAVEQIEQAAQPAPDMQQAVAAEVARQLAAIQQAAQQPAAAPAAPKIDEGILKAAAFALLKESLTPEQVEWVTLHVMKGAPGFTAFLQSEEIKTVVQLGFEQYTSFLQK